MSSSRQPSFKRPRGFSLVELLVSMSIVAFLVLFIAGIIESGSRIMVQTEQTADEMRNARNAMNALTRNLRQAVLNSYWDYDDPSKPTVFQRQSELHFVVGPADDLLGWTLPVQTHAVFFQAPLGFSGDEAGELGGGEDFNEMQDSLNCWGYFIELSSDLDKDRPLRPEFLRKKSILHPERERFRLMEFRLASEKMPLFGKNFPGESTIQDQKSEDGVRDWFRDEDRLVANSRPVAENIVALILRPRAPQEDEQIIAPEYLYDSRRFQFEPPKDAESLSAISRHQLPPIMEVTVVALSEDSYARVETTDQFLAENLETKLEQLFQKADRYEEDLDELEKFLTERTLSFRTLSFSIAIPAAKWITSKNS